MKGHFDEDGIFRAGDNTIRTTLRVNPDGSKMSALWEMNQGDSWNEWMKMSFTK